MTYSRDEVVELVREARVSWDLSGVKDKLESAIVTVQEDPTLLEVSKRPLLNLLRTAVVALEERYRSEPHLLDSLKAASRDGVLLTDEQAKHLTAWFFHVVYSGNAMSLDLANLIRPVLAKAQGNPGTNKKRLEQDIELYQRLARWGIDLHLSENNLHGLIEASLVLPLPESFGEKVRRRAEEAAAVLRRRESLSAEQLLYQSLELCRATIAEAFKRHRTNPEEFLSQDDTRALHICLHDMLRTISNTEGLADSAAEMSEEINRLRAQFQEIRFRSSKNLLVRTKEEIEDLAHAVGSRIDFARLEERASELGRTLQKAPHGTRGVNWMHPDHVGEAQAILREVSGRLRAKEKDAALFTLEMSSFVRSVEEIERAKGYVSAAQLKRLRAKISKGSSLLAWSRMCISDHEGRQSIEKQVEGIHERLNILWERMESQEEERAAAFARECESLAEELQSTKEPPRFLEEIVDLARCREDFTRKGKGIVQSHIDRLFELFRVRITDVELFKHYAKDIRATITACHRRIFSNIDFDDLNQRIGELRRWCHLRDFPTTYRAEAMREIGQCSAEVRKLRFRQDKAKRERQERSEMVAIEMLQETKDAQTVVETSPGKPETWQTLVELDKQFREVANLLSETQRNNLRTLIDACFQKVRAARAAFATEATAVFANYNELLSDTLLSLEDEASREAAFEAIERIKPIRAQLRSERRLLRSHRIELEGLLQAISTSIEEVFEQADERAAGEWARIQADCERLAAQIEGALTSNDIKELVAMHKELSGSLRDSKISIAARKEGRAELDRLWREIGERMQQAQSGRDRSENVDALLARLERQGYLLSVDRIPAI